MSGEWGEMPSHIRAKADEMMMLYGTAYIRKIWDEETGLVEWRVLGPDEIYKSDKSDTDKL